MKTSRTSSREKLDYKKMLEDICSLVENDWSFEMELHRIPPEKPFTQKEAREMEDCIGNVYLIAHGIHCVCGGKYKIAPKP